MNKRKAKEIFFQNDGQYYFMAHDGFYEEYRSYNIDKNTEDKWTKELINLRLRNFKKSSDMIHLISIVDHYNKYELLDELLSVKLRGTFINKFVIIELLTTLLAKNRSKIVNYNEKKMIVNMVSKIIERKNLEEYDKYSIENRLIKIKKKLRIK